MESYATAQQVFAGGLIFARIGAIIMLLPGIGEAFVPPRVRLAFAFVFALLMFPLIGQAVPALPATVSGLAGAVIKEVLIGLLIGGVFRLFMASLATAGEIVSIQTTLSFAQTANPAMGGSAATLSTFLSLVGMVLIMATNLHHLFIGAMVQSYAIFPFTKPILMGDAAQLAIQTVARSFALGLQMAAPVLVFALVFNIATGLVGRVMPQFQVFFVASPLLVLLGLSVFALSLGVMGMVWIDRYQDLVAPFAGGGARG
jgi:flagellar biosynthetic protein FliR